MPRYEKERLQGTPRIETASPAQGLSIVASPVDLTVRRQGGQNAMALADALKSMVPQLGALAKQKQKEQDDIDLREGQRTRDMQADTIVMPSLREQSKSFQSGYMRQHGLRMAILDGEETEKQYDLHKNDPTFNADQFFAQRRRDGMQGMSDPDAYEGYAPHAFRTEAKLRGEETKKAVLETRNEEFAGRVTEMAEIQRNLGDRSIAAGGASLDAFITKHYAKGVPYDVSRGEWMSALVQSNDAKPQDFEHLYQPDSSGIAPVDRKSPNGHAWRASIDNAKKLAQDREDKHADKVMADGARTFSLTHEKLLREDPMSIKDPLNYVSQASHVWKSPEAAANAYENILKVQDKFRARETKLAALRGASMLPRALAEDKEVIDLAHQEYYASWRTVDWNDANSVATHLERSTGYYEKWGIPDPFIKSMSERVKTMVMTKDKDGKKVLTPEFHTSYALYKSLRDSGNQQLGTFDDQSRVFLQTFDLSPGTEAERFAAAQTAIDPEAKKTITTMWSPGERQIAVDKAASDLYSSWRTKLHVDAKPGNARQIAELAVQHAELTRARGGNMTNEVAVSSALSKFQTMYTYDGHGSMVKIPQDVPAERATKMAAQYINDARTMLKDNGGKTIDNYVVTPMVFNGKPAFRLTDTLGIDIVPPRTFEELEYAEAKSRKATFEDASARLDAKGQVVINTARRDRAWSIEALKNGAINPEEFKTMQEDADRREDSVRKGKSDELRRAAMGAPQVPKADTADPSMRIPVPQPIGPEQTPKEIAMERAVKEPHVAMMAAGEGFRNKVFNDPNQKDKLIGFGYNISSRKEDVVRKDFAKAGITDPERQTRVLSGAEAITPDEAGRLAHLVKDKSIGIATEVVGAKVWDALPDHRKAVLIDLAYQTGDNSSAFRSALANLQKGNEPGVVSAMQVSFFKEKDQTRVMDHRRNNLRRAMWESPERFQQLVNSGV
jgi:hypothetical protein